MTSGLAAAVAAYGLPTSHRLPDSPLDDAPFHQVLAECEHHRLLGFLGTAVRDGAFPVTDPQRAEVEQRWAAWLAHALRIERLVLDATEVLDAHGIRSIVCKGVALAHTVYPDPAMRVFGDADVLVEPHHFTRAANLLIAEMGATRSLPELRPGFDDRFGKEILLRIRDLEFDLHRTFADGALGQTIVLPELFTETRPFLVGGRSLRALGSVPMTMHAAYSACFGDDPRRLASMRDLVELLGTVGDRTGDLIDTAQRWRAAAVLAAATIATARDLGARSQAPTATWASAYRPSTLERSLVRAHTGPGRGYTRHAAALAVVRGLRARGAYARAIALPGSTYLAARAMSRRGLARRAREAISATL
jgi:hypothetical protein